VVVDRVQNYSASLFDLLTAYATQRQREAVNTVQITRRQVWSLSEAREILTRLMGKLADWTPLDAFLSEYVVSEDERAGVIASSFAASLEMVREGKLEIRQSETFAPIYLRQPSNSKTTVAQA
jgi:segregation and condensation protein A